MPRKIEFMKKQEARIIVLLNQIDSKPDRHGGAIADKLDIDYIYTMKLLRGMYDKGWVKVHQFDGKTYFALKLKTPTFEAKERLAGKKSPQKTLE